MSGDGLPEGWLERLAEMPPGPGLSALLSTIDPTRLHGWQLIDVLDAHNRQVAFEQARLLRATRELAYAARTVAVGEPVRDLTQDPFAGTEIAFALTCTDHAADTLVDVALSTVDKTPELYDAMLAGRLDLTKAKVICTELADATDEHARQVIATMGPELDRCTTAQLRDRIRRLLLKLDPDAVRTRHQRAVESRWVHHQEHSDGTSALSGICLPKDKAAAAWDHVNAIAKATKAAGDVLGREIDQIRADVFADLLAGVDPTLAGAATPAVRKGVVNLHIGLTTLACLDDNPGAIPGFGPLIADIARQTVAQMADTAQWRFTVTGEDGDTVAEGKLRYRPTAAQKAFVNARDQTCRAPGCRPPAQACDRDHIRDWAHSKDTSIMNLCCLCARHHRAKHKGRFCIQRGLHGIDWTTPRGRRYTVLPDNADPPTDTEHRFAQHLHGHNTPSRLRR